jgi:hypothetical protein
MVTVTGTTTGGLADLWPLFGLLIETPRLQLRLPREDELPALAEAARDIAGPDGPRLQMPWMYGSSPDMERQLLQRRGGRWHAGACQLAPAAGSLPGRRAGRHAEPVGGGVRPAPLGRHRPVDHAGQARQRVRSTETPIGTPAVRLPSAPGSAGTRWLAVDA